jgi:uncharacterized protein
MAALARVLPDGKRLHLNHGPIDLVIGADGDADAVRHSYHAAMERFCSVLDELVAELPMLRGEATRCGFSLSGRIAKCMEQVVRPHWRSRVTPMAAVAGAVADDMLQCMVAAAPVHRAYVNNGGDIALHLGPGTSFTTASPTGMIVIQHDDDVRGIATSGWRGRSFSLGIADSVTVLARTAAAADVAATLIANAVDLPGSAKVKRQRACEIAPDSDLQDRLVTVAVGPLHTREIEEALRHGQDCAEQFLGGRYIASACLMLGEQVRSAPSGCLTTSERNGVKCLM